MMTTMIFEILVVFRYALYPKIWLYVNIQYLMIFNFHHKLVAKGLKIYATI